MASYNLEIVDYSERAVVLFGNTKPFKSNLEAIGAKFNPSLKYSEEERKPGWVFVKSKLKTLEQLVNDINQGKINASTETEKPKYVKQTSETNNTTQTTIDKKAFMNLVARVEQLEQELAMIKKYNIKSSSSVPSPASAEINFYEEDEEEEEEELPRNRPRLIGNRR